MSTLPITRQGVPNALLLGGMSESTRLLAPITQPSPIVTPLEMITFGPMKQLLPIRVLA